MKGGLSGELLYQTSTNQLKKVYEYYTNFVIKNPLFELNSTIDCVQFIEHLDNEVKDCKNIIQSYLQFKDVSFPMEDCRKILQCFVFIREYALNKSKYFNTKIKTSETINTNNNNNEEKTQELEEQINTLKNIV